MRNYISERVLLVARYIATTDATVRDAGKKFGLSKSTVHKDMTERLIFIDGSLYRSVRKVMLNNLAERHLRGGEATKSKWRKTKL